MGKSILGKIVLVSILLFALGSRTPAQEETPFLVEARHLYKDIPDVFILTSDGRRTSLSAIGQEKPILLTLVFSRCMGICSPLLSSLKESVEKIEESRRFSFYSVVLGFDPADTPEDMERLREVHKLSDRKNWIFGVFEDPMQKERFIEAIGFWYQQIGSTDQYDHPGMVVGIRQGKVVRILVGVDIPVAKLREVVHEIKGEFVPFYSIQRNIAFRCFNYDPETGETTMGVGALILFMPPFFTFILTASIFTISRRKGVPKAESRVAYG